MLAAQVERLDNQREVLESRVINLMHVHQVAAVLEHSRSVYSLGSFLFLWVGFRLDPFHLKQQRRFVAEVGLDTHLGAGLDDLLFTLLVEPLVVGKGSPPAENDMEF